MNYTNFLAWLAQLRIDNKDRQNVIAYIGRIEKVLAQPYDVNTLNKIYDFLLGLVKLDSLERITYSRGSTAGILYEAFQKRDQQNEFISTYPSAVEAPQKENYRKTIRAIILTPPEIFGETALSDFCINLINDSHESTISLEWLERQILDIVTAKLRSKDSDQLHLEQRIKSIKSDISVWLSNENDQKIPITLLDLLSDNEQGEYPLIIGKLNLIKAATREPMAVSCCIEYSSDIDNGSAIEGIDTKKIPSNDEQKFREELKRYAAQRREKATGNTGYDANHYIRFWGRLTGMNAGVKLRAIDDMLNALDGEDVDFSPKSLEALRDGELGKIIAKYEKLLPDAFVQAEKIQTIITLQTIRALR